ncbi:hypothetical protein [Bradyrhizobium oligotrophicum]|uniref:hypothetical protein n=1 Tax=Bradyrhizobium oligotrophicum TaxID=44255 RepID=UPI000349AA1F|nr:hypothetical protein [Bradyrhizobium oligotrophicum]
MCTRAWLATALLMPLLLGGCATSGTTPPSDTTQFGNTYNYLPVNDVPHDDQRPVLSVDQQEKLRNELMTVRDRQVPAAAKPAPAKPAAAKPAAAKPAAASPAPK